MFAYHVYLAWHSLRRTPILASLMVLAIGLGIGASMTMITVLHVMSGDPLPGRSAKLFVPTLDPRPLQQAQSAGSSFSTPNAFTWPDVVNLLREHQADRQAAMQQGGIAVRPERAGLHPFFESGEYVTSEFFSMFGVPFRAGSGWTADQDRERARVVVLNAKLDGKLFGNATGIGQTVRLNNTDFRVIGVLKGWDPQPRFYAQPGYGIFGRADEFFLPLQTALQLKFAISGNLSCWANVTHHLYTSDKCSWVQYWVEINSPAKVAAYRRYLTNYWRDQQAHGRFPRTNSPPHLYGLMAWLAHWHVVPANLSMQLWLAIGFLIVCMLSVVALLLAKFMRRSSEISIRRALGAQRRDIFMQFGVESGVIGVAGGLLGLIVAQIGLWGIRQRPEGYAHLAQMDISMLISTVVLAIVASVLAGLLPAWRACHVAPALQLRNQ